MAIAMDMCDSRESWITWENVGRGGKGKSWTDCVAEDRRVLGITGDWSTAVLDPGAWYSSVCEGGCRFMTAWVREAKRKGEVEEADKIELAPSVTVGSLRRFRTALIGSAQGLPKRHQLHR